MSRRYEPTPARMAGLMIVLALAALSPIGAYGDGQSPEESPSAADARAAFARLKALEGTWSGSSEDAHTGAPLLTGTLFTYRITGGGSALTEHAYAGSPEEMLSVFFLDGDRLLLQHYCSAGNQPLLELVRATSEQLEFALAGRGNVDPAVDGHIHRARFIFAPDAPVEAFWSWHEDGREHHVSRRVLHERG